MDWRQLRWVLAGGRLVSGACTDPAVPQGATLVVTIASAGEEIDPDGYLVRVDTAAPAAVATNGSATFNELSPGDHQIVLEGVAQNCVVVEPNPLAVSLTPADTTHVAFQIQCVAPHVPAGSVIAFSSNRDGDYAVYVMAVDGSGITRLTDPSIRSAAPAWSPDGTRLAYTSDQYCYRDLFVMAVNGSSTVRLTSCEGVDRHPAWSPDGRKILFDSDRGAACGDICGDDIWVMNADGSGSTRLTSGPGEDWLAAWSPDGREIAFSSDRAGVYPQLDIYVMDADGSNVVRLTNDGAFDIHPAWSPDGTKIAFSSSRDGHNEIYVMNADGSGVTRLTHDGGYDIHPTWSPDGTQIGFMRARIDVDGFIMGASIAAMNADGTGLVDRTDGSAEDGEPTCGIAATGPAAFTTFPAVTAGDSQSRSADRPQSQALPYAASTTADRARL